MSQRPPIERLRLVSSSPRGTRDDRVLRAEFPTVHVVNAAADEVEGEALIDEAAWRAAATFRPFDEAIETSSCASIGVRDAGKNVARSACEVLTRFQRFVGRLNAASRTPAFDAARTAHRALYDLDKPLVKADFDHALDTWQWLLRLDPSAGAPVQLAALFHDVERLESEADRRVEQHAPDYQAFKDAHARRGADLAYEVLVGAGMDEATAARTRAIVAAHERRADDVDVDLLNDADALSFFSLNSPGYADYFGPEQTKKKIAYTLGRLGPRAGAKLAGVRLRSDVRELFLEALAS